MKAVLTTALLLQAITPDVAGPTQAANRLLDRHVKMPVVGAALVPDGILQDGDDSVVRYELQLQGVSVIGRGAAVRVGPWAGEPALIHADVRLPAGAATGPWRLTVDDAVDVALSAMSKPTLRRSGVRVERAVVPSDPPVRVWSVIVPLAANGDSSFGPVTLRLLIDADDPQGRVVDWGRVDLGVSLGNVFPTNPVTSELEERELPWLDPDTDVLEGRYASVFRCRLRDGECQERSAAVADTDGDYLFEPDDEHQSERDPFSEVSAYFHITRMRQWFADLGLDSGALRRVLVWVNWPRLNNAAFVPGEDMMIFGQGRRDFAYDGDIVYHEYAHAVISVTAELRHVFSAGVAELDYRPGALNEGVADQFSTALSNDSKLGEYAGGYRYGAEIRDMVGDATCPGDLIGEEHHDSQPWGQATWEVREALGDELYLPLAWSTLVMLLPSSGIIEAAEVMEALAERRFLGDELKFAAVTEPFERHRLDLCDRFIPIDEGPGHSAVNLSSIELSQGQLLFDLPSHIQHTIEVPEGTAELHLIKRIIGCVLGCDQSLYLSVDKRIKFGLFADGTLEHDADEVYKSQTEIVIEDPQPGTWYIGNTNGSVSTFIYSMSGSVTPYPPAPDPEPTPEPEHEPDPDPTPDADPDPNPDDDPAGEGAPAGSGGDVDVPASGGCDCRQSGASPTPSPSALPPLRSLLRR